MEDEIISEVEPDANPEEDDTRTLRKDPAIILLTEENECYLTPVWESDAEFARLLCYIYSTINQRTFPMVITNSPNTISTTLPKPHARYYPPLPGAPVSVDTELGRHMTEFETRVRQDMDEIYTSGVCRVRTTEIAQQSYIRELTVQRTIGDNSDYKRCSAQTGPQDALQLTKGAKASKVDYRLRGRISRTGKDPLMVLMESVFHISNCTIENQVKFATCTLHSVALTWWNTHVKTVGHDAAYDMPWKTLMKMMTDKYCPQNEIMKLEMEICDLKVKGTDLTSLYQPNALGIGLCCAGRKFFLQKLKKLKNI
ncbi:hypothetical protein Tco_1378055 [Tanacetum coccineum]